MSTVTGPAVTAPAPPASQWPARRPLSWRRLRWPAGLLALVLALATGSALWWRVPDPFAATAPAGDAPAVRYGLPPGSPGPYLVGAGYLDSDGHPVTVRSVELLGADGIELIRAELRPVTAAPAVGAVAGVPDAPADGAVPVPGRLATGHEQVEVVVGIRRSGDAAGHLRGVVVHYAAAGLPHTRTIPVGVDAAAAPAGRTG